MSTTSISNTSFLDWRQRPDSFKPKIQKAYNAIVTMTASGWSKFNGSDTYGICGVDEHALDEKDHSRRSTQRT
jgi:hypothetical protein